MIGTWTTDLAESRTGDLVIYGFKFNSFSIPTLKSEIAYCNSFKLFIILCLYHFSGHKKSLIRVATKFEWKELGVQDSASSPERSESRIKK